MFHRCFRRRSKFPGTQLISASKGLPKHVFPTITCGHQFSRDDRSQNLCSAAWSESMIRDITWLFRAEMLPEAGLTQHYMNSYLSATTPRWMENMGNCRRSPWQNLSSVQFTSFSTPITCQSLRGRRRALLESPSTKHAKNVTRTNHSAQ